MEGHFDLATTKAKAAVKGSVVLSLSRFFNVEVGALVS